MKKRLLASLVAACFIISSLPPAFAVEGDCVRETQFFTSQYHANLNYDEMTYERVEMVEVEAAIAAVRALIGDGANAAQAEEAFKAVTDLFTTVLTGYTLLDIQTYQDVTDEAVYAEHQYVYDLYMTVMDELVLLIQDVLESPCAAFLEAQLSQADIEYYMDYEMMTDEEKALSNQEVALQNQYMAAAAQTFTAEYGGQAWDDDSAYNAFVNGEIDQDAYTAIIRAITANENAVLGEIYMKMVTLRQEIARSAGYDNYAQYAYEEIYQRDYGPDQLDEYFSAVKEFILPIYNVLYLLYYYSPDSDVYTADYSGHIALDMIEPYIGQMSSELAEAFSYMRDHGLYDTGFSDTKSEAGFTTMISAYGAPFFFNAPSGGLYDFTTAVHEFGHYNNFYWQPSGWNDDRPSIDVAEVHSQGMELLFSNYYSELFGDDAGLVRDYLLLNVCNSMTSTIYSELELYTYTTPDVTLQQINQEYRRLAAEYGYVGVNDPDTEMYEWVEIPHLFTSPCYYISYSVSAAGAFSFWLSAQDNYFDAVDDYLRFSALPADTGFQKAFAALGMGNPVSGSYIQELGSDLWDELELERRLAEEIYGGKYFTDVSYGDWYYESVQESAYYGIMVGTGQERFSPSELVTRSVAATVLWRLEGEPQSEGGRNFADVPADSWYTEAVGWSSENGIALGDGAAFFPNDILTREQMAAMLYRYARRLELTDEEGEEGTSLSNFTDAASVSPWAVEAMSWCVDHGVIQGSDTGDLLPGMGLSRAQFTTMAVRFIDLVFAPWDMVRVE